MGRREPSRAGRRIALVPDRVMVRSMPLLEQYPDLAATVERDLAERARPGAFIYTIVWLVVSSWDGLWTTDTIFTSVTLGILLMLSGLRIVHQRRLVRREGSSSVSMLALTALILTGALHWGALSAWMIASGEFEQLRTFFIVMLPAFAMGGTAVLGISPLIRQVYPCVVFAPSLLACAIVGGRENYILVVLALCSLGYVLIASRASSADYWAAIHNLRLANARAEMLKVLAVTDPLTGVKNRLSFNARFEEQWERCAQSRLPLAVVLVDLDHFKDINDTYGHLAGDECLRTVATALTTTVRDDIDTLARYGGEEFVGLLPGVDLVDASLIAERMVEVVGQLRIDYDGTVIATSCSAGVASVVPNAADDSGYVLAAADAALYEAKACGRNRMKIAAATP